MTESSTVPAWTIRRALADDAAALAELASRTFVEAFGAENTAADLAAHLARAYGEHQQRAECTSPDVIALVVEHGSSFIAYAQVRRSHAPSCMRMPRPVEVWRFYVDRPWHGRGVARALMHAALDAAARLGGESVWLSVWEKNPRAVAFYAKCGFQDVGETTFTVGSDVQTDRVMARLLPRGHGTGAGVSSGSR